MDNNLLTEIVTGLREVEQKRDCRILFAAESGSRAWGFPSPDSDHDIRFIYFHPLEWYLRLDVPKDTLEWFDGDLDYSGWDLRKALRLFALCNESMNEWFGSPIIYESHEYLTQKIRELIPAYFNPIKAVHHYLGLAAKFTQPVFCDEPVGIKSLFYILRPLLAGQWIVQYQTMPPTEFSRLVEETGIDSELQKQINDILHQKETAVEKAVIDIPKLLTDWIKSTSERLPQDAKKFPPREKNDWEPLHKLMFEIATGRL